MMLKAKYVGDGSYVTGIPARDLSAEEWEALTEEQQKAALAAKTHELLTGGKQKPVKEE